MTFRRLAAIALIFLGTSVAWTVLGASLVNRSGEFNDRLSREVQLLWGRPHRQIAPNAWILRPGVETQVEETKNPQGGVVRRQVSYGATLDVPWGISESAYNVRDLELTYQYSNFGVPGLGL